VHIQTATVHHIASTVVVTLIYNLRSRHMYTRVTNFTKFLLWAQGVWLTCRSVYTPVYTALLSNYYEPWLGESEGDHVPWDVFDVLGIAGCVLAVIDLLLSTRKDHLDIICCQLVFRKTSPAAGPRCTTAH